jgi:hypothetical protein
MNPSKKAPRRLRRLQPGAETLESRELLTGGAGNTFAILPGSIDKAGDTVSVPFTIDTTHFTRPNGKMALGIDVAPDPSGTLKPLISSVTDPHGDVVHQTFHSIYAPHLKHRQVASGQGTSAVLTPVSSFPSDANKPVTSTVQVTATAKSSGSFLLGFYLPGDANGDGKVDQTDLKEVKSELGARAGTTRYNFSADANRDGRIARIDVAYTLQNMGVSTTVTPVVSANLDPASVTNPAGRSTTNPSARFTGVATPGATLTYTNTSHTDMAPISVNAGADGNYAITTPLGVGSNVFQVKAVDAFGQTISGNIANVTYSPKT